MRDTRTKNQWVVYAAYEHAGYQRGAIISTHKTYELALASLNRHGWETFRAVGMLP